MVLSSYETALQYQGTPSGISSLPSGHPAIKMMGARCISERQSHTTTAISKESQAEGIMIYSRFSNDLSKAFT